MIARAVQRYSMIIFTVCCASVFVCTVLFFYCTFSKHPDFDLNITTSDMIRQEGYQVEEHTVTTEDGYLLTMHRIPGIDGSPAVFIQHGLLSNSFDWVVTGKNKGLAFMLADHGYDVWMGNSRGNTYSRCHENYASTESRFWNFSWHEMGVYDLPAEITYITNIKKDSIIYIGHSMGTTMFFVMAIERPDIAAKVKMMFSFAPVAFTYNIKSPIRYFSRFVNQIETLNELLGINTLLPQTSVLRYISKYGCEIFLMESNICIQIMFAIAGYDAKQFNYTILPLILSHTPAGSSMKTLYHYLQSINTGRFQYYDYGLTNNLQTYNRSDPPDYDLSKIQVPIGVFWSENDLFADPPDVKMFYDSIPNKILYHKVQYSKFSHVDYMWAIDAPKLLYSELLTVMKNHSK